jgi:tRNA-guanine family transglycosylase
MSWYYGDPEYQLIDRECNVLVSPTSVPKTWNVEKFRIKPASLMIDSGSFHFIDTDKNALTKTQKEVFETQLRIIHKFRPAIICHLDFAIPRKGLPENFMKERIEITIENAEKFYDLYLSNRNNLIGIEPLAVIQGYDTESLTYCAKCLKKIGFRIYGIGSIARLSRINRNEILRRVEKVLSIVKNLHVFGVTSVQIIKELQRLGVSSVDSTTPIKESIYSGVLYSAPFRRYKIDTYHFRNSWSKKYGYAKVLKKPLSCDCPICRNFGREVILRRGKKIWNNLRALHNYYHFKKELFGIFCERKNVNLSVHLHKFNEGKTRG